MPFGDGTGPMGLGPMTGRAAGYCAGYGVPGFMNPIPGRFGAWWGFRPGWFWGRGRGRGWRHWYWLTGLPGWARWGWPGAWWAAPYAAGVPYAPFGGLSKEDELQLLRRQAEYLEKALEEVRQQLSALESEGSSEEGK